MRWRWVFIGVVGLLLAVVVGGYLLVSYYDFNTLKPQLAQVVKAHTGRELVFGGDIDVKFGLIPAVVVENVSFQNAPWGSRPELARVKRLEVQVALLPLLRRDIVLQRLLLVQPDILIETDHSGQSNLPLATRKTAPATAPRQAPRQDETTVPLLLINRLRLEQGRLTYKDGQTGKTHVVDLERLSATGDGPGEPIKLALQGAYNAQSFEAEGTLGALAALSSPSTPWPFTIRATGAGATVTVDGTMQDVLHGRGLAMHITAQGASIPAVLKLVDVNHVPELGPFQVSFTVADPAGTIEVQQLKAEVGSEDVVHLRLAGAIKDVRAQQGLDVRFTMQGKDLQSLQTLVGRPLPVPGPFEVSGRATDRGRLAYQVADLQAVFPSLALNGTGEVHLAGPRPQFTARLAAERMDLRPFFLQRKSPNPPGRPPRRPKTTSFSPRNPCLCRVCSTLTPRLSCALNSF